MRSAPPPLRGEAAAGLAAPPSRMPPKRIRADAIRS
jgi:hypothetical protein